MALTLPVGGLTAIEVPLAGKVAGAAVDPTTFAVKLAFIVGDAQPAAADLKTAAWATDTTTTPNRPTYLATIVVGAGNTTGAPTTVGTYNVWAQIDTGTQKPLVPCGELVLY